MATKQNDAYGTNIAMSAVSMKENLAYGCPDGMDMDIDAYGTNVAMGAVSMEENLSYVEVETSLNSHMYISNKTWSSHRTKPTPLIQMRLRRCNSPNICHSGFKSRR